MPTQLMFYESAVPVSSKHHVGLSVKVGGDYGFARRANSVPLTAIEMASAAPEYVAVFAGQGDTVQPVVILGLEQEHNLYVDDNGTWDAVYVPAFVRRYPFVFAGSEDGKGWTLCLDESFAGCNREGRGEQLFDADGERTRYLETVLAFLRDYQIQHERTRAFCKRLAELGLLEPMHAQFTLEDGARRTLTGFMAVNRSKLKALRRETLADLAMSDELELIYLHLHSLQNFNRVLQRAGARAATSTAPGHEAEADLDAAGVPVTH